MGSINLERINDTEDVKHMTKVEIMMLNNMIVDLAEDLNDEKKEKKEALKIVHELIYKTCMVNYDMAKDVLNEFEVNPKNDQCIKNKKNLVDNLRALKKIEYYDRSGPLNTKKFFESEKMKQKHYELVISDNDQLIKRLKRDKEELQRQIDALKDAQLNEKRKRKVEGNGIRIDIKHKEKEKVAQEEVSVVENEEKKEPLVSEASVPKEEKDLPIFVDCLKKLDNVNIEFNAKQNTTYVIDGSGDKVPVFYIDFEIEDAKRVGELMEDVKKVYFVFKDRKMFNKANPKISTWIFNSGRIDEIEFSYNVLDEIPKKGLENFLTM